MQCIPSPYRTVLGGNLNMTAYDFLHYILHPRLDQLVYILIYTVTPEYVLRAEVLEDTHRLGCSNPMTTYQKYFKSAWPKLAEQPIGSRAYLTNVEDRTCNCGHQKYQRHHICKHLQVVQAVSTPINFWGAIVRRRTTPLYQHPALAPKKEDGITSYE
jgi:hypothetical protein